MSDPTQDLLDSLVADATAAKEAKATQLTPVGTEAGGPLSRPLSVLGASFPNDMPTEVMAEAVRDIRRVMVHLSDAIAALEEAIAGTPSVAVTESPAEKARAIAAERAEAEKVADVSAFRAEYERKSLDAQTAAFRDAAMKYFDAKPYEGPAPEPAPAAGPRRLEWTCSVHGSANLKYKVGQSRSFWVCTAPGCREFER